MTHTELDQKVLSLIAQVSTVKREQMQPQQRLREDLGMDSVSSMELLSMLAEELDLDISVEDAAGTKTVAATLALVQRYYDQRGGRS